MKYKNLSVICSIIIIAGCISDVGRKNNNNFNIITEYVGRIGKKLLIVSDSNKLNNSTVVFDLDTTNKLWLKITAEPPIKITTTYGVLEQLQDEAELAAILAIALATLDHTEPRDFDEKIINYLYKAGYNPMAFIDLQEEYLANQYNQENNQQNNNWLEFLFLNKLTKTTVSLNKQLAITLSKGTQRAKERYFSNIRLLRSLKNLTNS